jgi:WD40 repeat protein
VLSAAFSPDGTRIVTTGGTSTYGEVTVWDARTGAELLGLNGHTAWVMRSAFSPDGTHLITGSFDGTAKVWDARTGTGRLELGEQRNTVSGLSFSPDGTRLATACGDRTAKVWDARNGSVLFELKEVKGTVRTVSFSPDGTRIITAGGGGGKPGHATVWDVQTRKPELELRGFKEGVLSAAFSPDGAWIATGGAQFGHGQDGYELKMWDARKGQVLYDLTEASQEPVFSPNAPGWKVAFSSAGTRLVTAGGNDRQQRGNAVIVRDVRTGKALVQIKIMALCVAFSPDGKRIVTGGFDLAKVWDAETGTQLFELKGHQGPVQSAAFSPDGKRIVTGSHDKTVKVWDVRTGAILVELKGHTGAVQCVGFSPDGAQIITGGGDPGKPGEAFLWDARAVPTPVELKGHTEHILSVTFSPDSARIATASDDGTVKLWDTRTGTVLHNLMGSKSNLQDLAFSPDGSRLLTSGDGPAAKVWDAQTGKALFDMKGHASAVQCVAFSPDGTRIVTGGYRTDTSDREKSEVTVWDAQTGTALFDLKGHGSGLRGVVFTPDGARIVTRSHDGGRLWDARTGKELVNEPIPTTLEKSHISPDGQLLARVDGNRVQLIPLKLDAEELAYRRARMEPNPGRYRDDYLAARAAKDDFAAGFYLNLIPPAERKALVARADVGDLAPLYSLINKHLGDGGRPDLALPILVEIANVKKAKLGPEDPETLEALDGLGYLHWRLRQFDKAIAVFEEIVKVRQARYARDDLETLNAMDKLGNRHWQMAISTRPSRCWRRSSRFARRNSDGATCRRSMRWGPWARTTRAWAG